MDQRTGALQVSGIADLDYEVQSQYVIELTVTDNGLPAPQAASKTFTIDLVNVNDAPVLTFSRDIAFDYAATHTNMLVATATMFDEDGPHKQELLLELEGPDATRFVLNVTSNNAGHVTAPARLPIGEYRLEASLTDVPVRSDWLPISVQKHVTVAVRASIKLGAELTENDCAAVLHADTNATFALPLLEQFYATLGLPPGSIDAVEVLCGAQRRRAGANEPPVVVLNLPVLPSPVDMSPEALSALLQNAVSNGTSPFFNSTFVTDPSQIRLFFISSTAPAAASSSSSSASVSIGIGAGVGVAIVLVVVILLVYRHGRTTKYSSRSAASTHQSLAGYPSTSSTAAGGSKPVEGLGAYLLQEHGLEIDTGDVEDFVASPKTGHEVGEMDDDFFMEPDVWRTVTASKASSHSSFWVNPILFLDDAPVGESTELSSFDAAPVGSHLTRRATLLESLSKSGSLFLGNDFPATRTANDDDADDATHAAYPNHPDHSDTDDDDNFLADDDDDDDAEDPNFLVDDDDDDQL